MQDLINQWMENLTNKATRTPADVGNYKFTCEEGKRYYKIISEYYSQKSVHAFVDKNTGDVYKPAGWKAPAKGARFNLFRDIEYMLNICDIYGGYLYKNRVVHQ